MSLIVVSNMQSALFWVSGILPCGIILKHFLLGEKIFKKPNFGDVLCLMAGMLFTWFGFVSIILIQTISYVIKRNTSQQG